ncbi:transglutaminase-like domain-containing protein [Candidatus Poribacteria bacterium]
MTLDGTELCFRNRAAKGFAAIQAVALDVMKIILFFISLALVFLVNEAMTAQVVVEGEAGYMHVVVDVKNPVYRPNRIFSAPEDLASPRFKGLVDRYWLDEVVKDESDEFRRILMLRNWLHEYVVVDRSKPAAGGSNGDALLMLQESPKGGRYHCSHYMIMLNAVLNSMGHVARCIFAAAGEKEESLSGAHGMNEVWVNSLCKWVMVDAEHDSHFEKDGVPLSALEIRSHVLSNGGESVFRHKGQSRQRQPGEPDDTWGRTPRTYAWVAWYPEANIHTIWPKRRSGYEYILDDDYWRNNTWYRGGKKHWAYKAGYFKPIKESGLIYYTPNVLEVNTHIEGTAARVTIESDTPSLKQYQIRRRGEDWEPVAERFTLKLTESRHEWWLRSVNLAGVGGPEHRLVIEHR